MNLTKQQSKTIKEIVNLCLEIELKTPHTPIFSYRPHIDSFSVDIFKDGFTYEKNDNQDWESYLVLLDNQTKCDKLKLTLEKMLK